MRVFLRITLPEQSEKATPDEYSTFYCDVSKKPLTFIAISTFKNIYDVSYFQEV